MDPAFGHLLDDFTADAEESLERIADALHQPTVAGPEGAAATLPAVQRDLHTLKGNASMMELDAVVSVAHEMEELCARLSGGDEETLVPLAEGAALLRLMVTRLHETRGAFRGNELAAAFGQRCREGAGPRSPEGGSDAEALATDAAIRVDFAALERLGNLAIEATTLSASLSEKGPTGRSGPQAAEEAIAALSTSLRELRDGLSQLRLVPAAKLLRRYARYVQEAGKRKGADVRITTTGAQTPLDKAMMDRLQEPLLHLLRNSVAHGVESPAERARAGKPPTATIAIDIRLANGRALIRVADDGRGLPMDAIVARAVARGVDVTRMSDAERRRLVFLPGLSTATEVSEMAGRGVGLDAVRTAVHAMGGEIDVESSEGAGTAFTLSVPVTSAVVRGVLVEVDGETWLAPFDGLRTAVPFEATSLRRIDGVDVVPDGAGLLPVVDGGALLGSAARGETRSMCLVLEAGTRRRGLLVDRVLSPGEFAFKRLDERLHASRSFGGAVVLGDGRVALVVDPHGMGGAGA